MAKMDKKDIIWGEKKSQPLESFNLGACQKAVSAMVDAMSGGTIECNFSGVRKAIEDASKGKIPNAYVKVGLVGEHLVLRVKEKKFTGDKEHDAVLSRNFKGAMDAYEAKQQRAIDEVMRNYIGIGSIAEELEGIPVRLNTADDFITAGRLGQAAKELSRIENLLRSATDGLRSSGLKEKIGYATGAVGIGAGLIDPGVFKSAMASLVAPLREVKARFAEVEQHLEEAETANPVAYEQTDSVDPAYQQRFVTLVRAYKALEDQIRASLPAAARLGSTSESWTDQVDAVPTPDKLIFTINAVYDGIFELESGVVTLMKPARQKTGVFASIPLDQTDSLEDGANKMGAWSRCLSANRLLLEQFAKVQRNGIAALNLLAERHADKPLVVSSAARLKAKLAKVINWTA